MQNIMLRRRAGTDAPYLHHRQHRDAPPWVWAREIPLYNLSGLGNLTGVQLNPMRISRTCFFAALAGVASFFATGCVGPEQKLGRGMNNLTEFARLGELRRTMEQSSLYDQPEITYTSGFLKGFNRSMLRTAVGAFEVLTFPIPSYDPWLKPGNELVNDISVHPVYPDSYRPGLLSESTFHPQNNFGFGTGDIAPFIPGSRFRIHDY
ncbi:MAG: exosortase system-associated protein, TIGR04073 family [Verrucomicrobia bacterium]|nr:exosortase system-associated protein, TIGR04073 family [Verrucomicrobiota bacterium]